MVVLFYTLLLLVIMNFYLMVRKRNMLSATEKFLISLMSIGVFFLLAYVVAYFFADYFARMQNPVFNNVFLIAMNLILPVITVEIVLALYSHFVLNKRN